MEEEKKRKKQRYIRLTVGEKQEREREKPGIENVGNENDIQKVETKKEEEMMMREERKRESEL